MPAFPKGGLIGRAVAAAKQITAMQIPLYAAYAGFFLILAVFPALLLILSALRYTHLDVETLISFLSEILPHALQDAMEELIYSTYQASTGGVVGFSAVAALWSSSKGVYGLLKGMNAIYGASEDRGYAYTRLISVVYTFLFLLVMVLTLILHVFGNGVISMLTMIDHPLVIFLIDMIDLRFFLLLFLQTALFTAIFVVLPNRRNRIRDSLPGAMFSSGGWLIFSDIYSGYVNRFSGYANIYGSVYAIALSMLWLYCCMSLVFYGGALNVYLKSLQEK